MNKDCESRFGVGLSIFGHPCLCAVEALERSVVSVCLYLSVCVDVTKKDASVYIRDQLKKCFAM